MKDYIEALTEIEYIIQRLCVGLHIKMEQQQTEKELIGRLKVVVDSMCDKTNTPQSPKIYSKQTLPKVDSSKIVRNIP